ncbi:MAG: biotin transporter BioY [Candidatus Cloacimonadota bacterium]|nr:MAG: biotin transporter BioY [Candidatus Cloacimonadota bacterium]
MHNVKAVISKSVEIPRNITMIVGSFIFATLITIGAFVYIPLPFSPVPITLQVLFVLLAGVLLGTRYGTLSVLIYILVGAVGVPVFAGAIGGIARIAGPTGGYLAGFLIAPSIVSFLFARMGKHVFAAAIAMLAGLFVIYFLGMLHLSLFLGTTLLHTLKIGVLPFVAGDIVKIILAVFLVFITRRRLWNA